MEIKEKRRLYRCGDNFVTNEQIQSWAEVKQLVEGTSFKYLQRAQGIVFSVENTNSEIEATIKTLNYSKDEN